MPHSSKSYIWWHGAQCRGVDGRPDKSCSRRASWRVLYPPKSGFEGGYVGASRFGRRPYVDSRAQLTEGQRMHSGRCGGVLSSRAPTAPRMVL
jgi:hypothetical protein